ncbi:hypothetical protein SESBI_15846, partial [Sesbania bispinosa]
ESDIHFTISFSHLCLLTGALIFYSSKRSYFPTALHPYDEIVRQKKWWVAQQAPRCDHNNIAGSMATQVTEKDIPTVSLHFL